MGNLIDIGGDTTICDANTLMINLPTTASYIWQDGQTTSNYMVTTSGQYWVEATSEQGCIDRDTIMVDFGQLENVTLGVDTILCTGDTIVITPSIVAETYLWSTGATTSTIQVSSADTYWVEVEEQGCVDSDTIMISSIEDIINLGSDTTICIGDNLSFSLPNEGSYLWQDGTITSTYTIDTAGLYWVESQNQCMDRDTIMVTELEIDAAILASDLVICDEEPVLLAVDKGDPGVMINWSTGSSDPSIIVEAAGIYKVTISSGGCMATDSIVITSQSDCDCHVYIPNVFDIKSQVGNHLFTISSNCTLSDYKLSIFDRWGGLIYNTQDIARQWDGKMADQRINTGVYPYLVEYRTSVDGQILRERGTVLLID